MARSPIVQVSLSAPLAYQVRRAAQAEAATVSEWIRNAVRERLKASGALDTLTPRVFAMFVHEFRKHFVLPAECMTNKLNTALAECRRGSCLDFDTQDDQAPQIELRDLTEVSCTLSHSDLTEIDNGVFPDQLASAARAFAAELGRVIAGGEYVALRVPAGRYQLSELDPVTRVPISVALDEDTYTFSVLSGVSDLWARFRPDVKKLFATMNPTITRFAALAGVLLACASPTPPLVEPCDADTYVRAAWGEHPPVSAAATPTWTRPADSVRDARITQDHHVALKDAHASGGCRWSSDRKDRFSSHTGNLNPTTGSFNSSKGSRTPDRLTGIAERIIDTPLERCRYARQHVMVKDHWGLTMTDSEKTVVTAWMEGCK